jgi:hypothetical protein
MRGALGTGKKEIERRRLDPRSASYSRLKRDEARQLRNPKTETRRKAETRNPGLAQTKGLPLPQDGCVFGLRNSDLGFPSAFGLRVSDLE